MTKDRFLEYISYEKRFSPHTVASYRTDLCQFLQYLKEHYELDDGVGATHQMVRSWVVDLMERGISPRSVNRKITTLRTYYRFLLREKQVDENPTSKITPPKSSRRLPGFVEAGQMMMLFEEVDFGRGVGGMRNRLIMEMLYATGIRLSELINLKEENVDLQKGTIKVTGKRNKQRIIPLTDKLVALIREYQAERRMETPAATAGSYLFLTDKGEKLYPRMVYRLVNSSLKKITTLTRKSPHMIRHTFATHMLNNGADLNVIKEILGHASLAATQVYTHNTIEKLKTIYQKAHPRA